MKLMKAHPSTYALRLRQALPLETKIEMSIWRIRQWVKRYGEGGVYVSFSGGKDSTVLLHLVRSIFPKVKAVFCNTGLEYPEVVDFVNQTENVDVIRPAMNFRAVLEKYGYPVVSKEQAMAISRYRNTTDPIQKYRRLNGWPNGKKGMISKKWQYLINAPFKISEQCCVAMKKRPMKLYAKQTGRVPFIGMMAGESNMRLRMLGETGCNAYDLKEPKSNPLAFWTEQDVLQFLKDRNIPYSHIYRDIVVIDGVLQTTGEARTGCMFCMFGVHTEKEPNRFQRMKITHPAQHRFCMNKLGMKEILAHMGVPSGCNDGYLFEGVS